MTNGPHHWRKSSHSGTGGSCVELWRKSSYSGTGGDCVEVAASLGLVRDSKNPDGPRLRADLTAFLTAVRSNHITR
ncbi:MAG TPA: DUF397 domain-containing protein [Pseudonocardiaceae bacterium]|nr:DUF397 domain-containing protein [Pseudonocardiaceae bacterium]